jgi:glycosyltransferase involved in cell wall biosynthesis
VRAANEPRAEAARASTGLKGPLVSVIVAVYNGERFVGECLESIFAQDYHPFEAIVVDDGSDDRTAEIVRSFPEVTYIYQENQGPSVARNTGFAAAKGEFISFFDHDDLMMPNKLSVQVGYLLSHPEADCVLGRQEVFSEPGVQVPSWVGRADFQLLSFVIRRHVVDEVGGFDPEYRLQQDTEWVTRLLARGFKIQTCPEVVMRRRFHGSNSAYLPRDHKALLKMFKARAAEKRAAAQGETG